MNWTKEKQTRLDAFEIRNKWPALAAADFFDFYALAEARAASQALHAADVASCNDNDHVRAERRQERAEKRARMAAAALFASISDAFLSRGVIISSDFVRITENGYCFRYIEIQDKNNYYNLID